MFGWYLMSIHPLLSLGVRYHRSHGRLCSEPNVSLFHEGCAGTRRTNDQGPTDCCALHNEAPCELYMAKDGSEGAVGGFSPLHRCNSIRERGGWWRKREDEQE
jgi:hypothetical protein